jgi:hypothetical protein
MPNLKRKHDQEDWAEEDWSTGYEEDWGRYDDGWDWGEEATSSGQQGKKIKQKLTTGGGQKGGWTKGGQPGQRFCEKCKMWKWQNQWRNGEGGQYGIRTYGDKPCKNELSCSVGGETCDACKLTAQRAQCRGEIASALSHSCWVLKELTQSAKTVWEAQQHRTSEEQSMLMIATAKCLQEDFLKLNVEELQTAIDNLKKQFNAQVL